jgi:hypothetical protein
VAIDMTGQRVVPDGRGGEAMSEGPPIKSSVRAQFGKGATTSEATGFWPGA